MPRRMNDSFGAVTFAKSAKGPVVLMVRARKGWSFPKGHREGDESPAQCAERETKEETGISARVSTAFVFAVPDANGEPDRTVYFFLGKSGAGDETPVAGEVGGAEWVPVGAAEERILFAPDREAYRAARAFLKAHENAPAPKHILITAEKQTGKSTLIRRLLAETRLPVYGFMTKAGVPDETGFHDIFIHPAARPEAERVYGPENRIGRCDRVTHLINNEVFDGLGTELIRVAKPGGLIVMDELGFMEKDAAVFRSAVREALLGGIPVLAAVKTRYDVPFLNELRALPACAVYDLTKENRDDLFERLLPVVKGWER